MRLPIRNQNRLLVAFAGGTLVVLLVAWLVYSLPPHGQLAYTPDSIHYLEAAHNLRRGLGLTLFNYALFDPKYIPYTVWPPLYPILLSTGGAPILIHAAVMASLSALIFWILVYRVAFAVVPAAISAVVIALPWPMLVDASYLWSEPLAMFFVFLSIAIFMGLFTAHELRVAIAIRRWLLALVALALAIYARYAALVFVPGIMVALFGVSLTWRARLGLFVLTPLVVLCLLSPLFAHNLLATGYISGDRRLSSNTDFIGLFSSCLYYLGWIFGGDRLSHIVMVTSILSLIGIALLIVLDQLREQGEGDEVHLPKNIHFMAFFVTGLVVCYVIGIVILRSWRTFDWGTRIVSPATPLLLMSLVLWARLLWQKMERMWQRVIVVTPIVVLLGLAGLTSWKMRTYAWHNWRTVGSPQWHVNPLSVYTNLYPVTLPQFRGFILGSRPSLMAFRTGWDFRSIPQGAWSHAMLMRIVTNARGVLIDGQQAARLAQALHGLVPNPRVLEMGREPLLIWGPPQKALGE